MNGNVRGDVSTSLTINFPQPLAGGELILVMAMGIVYSPGSGVGGISGHVNNGGGNRNLVSPVTGMPTFANAGPAALYKSGAAGDTGVTLTISSGADANHYLGAVIIVANQPVYSGSDNAGAAVTGSVSSPNSISTTFPTSPANGISFAPLMAREAGGAPSGTNPAWNATDAHGTLLFGNGGGGNLQYGIGAGVSRTTATYTVSAASPATAVTYGLYTFNHV